MFSRSVTNSSGALQAQYAYDPYGRGTLLQGSVSSYFQYGGYYFHSPSGLNVTVHRSYSPVLGKWLSRDPIGEQESPNLYNYVNNDPIAWNDPSGFIAGVLGGHLNGHRLLTGPIYISFHPGFIGSRHNFLGSRRNFRGSHQIFIGPRRSFRGNRQNIDY